MSGDTLYFDGACHLCRAEINGLQGRCNGDINFQDIHTLSQDPTLPPRPLLLRSLHLRRGDGTMMVGLEANIVVWKHTSFARLGRLLSLPLVFPFANWVYDHWASWRYRRLYNEDGTFRGKRPYKKQEQTTYAH